MKRMPALLIAIAFTFGCNREKNKLPDLPRGFSVEVDGAKWIGTSSRAITGYTRSCYNCRKDSTFDIVVHDTISKRSMYINMNKWPGKTGNYNYLDTTPSLLFLYVLNDTSVFRDHYYGVLGSINIIKLSADNAQGTFWAKMVPNHSSKDTIIFANGTFNLPLE